MIQSPAPTSLPFGFQLAAFILSAVLAAIRVVEFFNRPKLSVHLTRDLFFRLIDMGEALFCHAVLLASSGPVLIRDVRPVLKRVSKDRTTERAEKSFPLEVWQHGQVVPGSARMADHQFHGSSALVYLGADTPYRAVYACLQKEYREKQTSAVTRFVSDIQHFRSSNANASPDERDRLRSEIKALIDKHYHSMVSLIQLESGDYELQVTVVYESIGRRVGRKHRTVTSKLAFSIESLAIENWKAGLRSLLEQRAEQLLTNQQSDLIYPALLATQVTEFPN